MSTLTSTGTSTVDDDHPITSISTADEGHNNANGHGGNDVST